MDINEWCAHIGGQVDTLTRAFAALAVTHPDGEKAIALLAATLKSAAIEEADLPAQKAYKSATAAAVAQLLAAVQIAKHTRDLDQKKKN
jgi:hypothetical protein